MNQAAGIRTNLIFRTGRRDASFELASERVEL